MAASTSIPVREYLNTAYRPDCDYVDGVLIERNVGELDHSDLQGEFVAWFRSRRRTLGVYAFLAQRVQVSRSRFRVPDVCVVTGPKPKDQIFRTPPLIAIEILSKDDRMSQMQERIDDYLIFGVRYVWLVDPRTRRALVHTSQSSFEAKDNILRTTDPDIELALAEIFANLD